MSKFVLPWMLSTVAVMVLMARSAEAEPITFAFTATIVGTSADGPKPYPFFPSGVQAGDEVRGGVTFDPQSRDFNADPFVGSYRSAISAMNFEVPGRGEVKFPRGVASEVSVIFVEDDHFQGEEDLIEFFSLPNIVPNSASQMLLAFEDAGSQRQPIDSDKIPTDVLVYDAFQQRILLFIDEYETPEGQIATFSFGGNIKSFQPVETSPPVPEPGTVLLLGLGAATLAGKHVSVLRVRRRPSRNLRTTTSRTLTVQKTGDTVTPVDGEQLS